MKKMFSLIFATVFILAMVVSCVNKANTNVSDPIEEVIIVSDSTAVDTTSIRIEKKAVDLTVVTEKDTVL